jgi:transcriptional regulator
MPPYRDMPEDEFEARRLAMHYAQMLESRARAADRAIGLATPYGERMSCQELAEWFGTTAADIRMTEKAALEKLGNQELAHSLYLTLTAPPA